MKTNRQEHPTCLVIVGMWRSHLSYFQEKSTTKNKIMSIILIFLIAAPNIPLLGMIPKIPNISFCFLFFILAACRTNFLWALWAKEECLIFHPMVFLWNGCCQFSSHYVCFVLVILIVLILVVPYSHHVASVFPMGSCTWEVALSKVTFVRHLCSTVSLSLIQASSSLTSIHRVKALSQLWRYMWAKPTLNQVCFRSGAAFFLFNLSFL